MSAKFDELVSVMRRLRAPGGCPWDREQTHRSLAQYLLEETYEAFDAIHEADETGNKASLAEELGDVLLQVVFHSTIAAENEDFTIDDVIGGITEKLILRHPHVFGDEELETAADVLRNWDELKKIERTASGKPEKVRESMLDEVSSHFPALLEGQKLTTAAARIGFDWEDHTQVLAKLDEELEELKAAISSGGEDSVAEEVGDLLFVVMNIARKLDVDAETALRRTNRKFRKRFAFIERELKKRSVRPEDAGLGELDELWEMAKSG